MSIFQALFLLANKNFRLIYSKVSGKQLRWKKAKPEVREPSQAKPKADPEITKEQLSFVLFWFLVPTAPTSSPNPKRNHSPNPKWNHFDWLFSYTRGSTQCAFTLRLSSIRYSVFVIQYSVIRPVRYGIFSRLHIRSISHCTHNWRSSSRTLCSFVCPDDGLGASSKLNNWNLRLKCALHRARSTHRALPHLIAGRNWSSI